MSMKERSKNTSNRRLTKLCKRSSMIIKMKNFETWKMRFLKVQMIQNVNFSSQSRNTPRLMDHLKVARRADLAKTVDRTTVYLIM